jgi:hypothetical protein
MSFDAVVCYQEYPNEAETGKDRDVARNEVFGPVLGTHRVISRRIGIGELSLVTRYDDHSTLLFPTGHPRHPEYRHDWFVGVESDGAWASGDPAPPERISDGSVYLGILKG